MVKQKDNEVIIRIHNKPSIESLINLLLEMTNQL